MPRKLTTRCRKEPLARYVTITNWRTSLSVRVDKRRGQLPARDTLHCVEFRGRLEEPVNGVSELTGMIFPNDDVSMSTVVEPNIGTIIQLRPAMMVVVTFTPQEFSWLLTLVAGNQLGAGHMSFSQPVRGKAFVHSLSFDNALPPEDER